MAEKTIRLADVGELERKLENALENLIPGKEDKEDEWLPRNVATELEDLKKLPTIDPEKLRDVSEWELNPYRFSCEHFRCKKCHHISCLTDAFCGGCKMEDATNEQTEIS